MSEPPALRASDADRERTVALLRDHAAEGRLTLEEFTERMSAAYLARTGTELDELARDLPSSHAPVTSRRRPTRFLFSLFGSTEREGRIRLRRRVSCLTGFGNIDLDLRQATLEGDVITIVALGVFGTIDVYVPEGVEVDLHGIALGGHKRARGNDRQPQLGTPLVCVWAVSLFAGIDDEDRGHRPRFPCYETPGRPGRRSFATIGIPVDDGMDLNAATREALLEMIDHLEATYGFERAAAYVLCSVAVDLRISEVVDVPYPVVSALLPLDVFEVSPTAAA